MYRIVESGGYFQVQKKSFLFWTNCYYFTPDYSRYLARYGSYEEALNYLGYKDFLED